MHVAVAGVASCVVLVASCDVLASLTAVTLVTASRTVVDAVAD